MKTLIINFNELPTGISLLQSIVILLFNQFKNDIKNGNFFDFYDRKKRSETLISLEENLSVHENGVDEYDEIDKMILLSAAINIYKQITNAMLLFGYDSIKIINSDIRSEENIIEDNHSIKILQSYINIF